MRCDNEDPDQQPKSSYWTQQLFNYEANDSERFVCAGQDTFYIEILTEYKILPHFHHYGDCKGPGNLYIHPKKKLKLEIATGREYQKPGGGPASEKSFMVWV